MATAHTFVSCFLLLLYHVLYHDVTNGSDLIWSTRPSVPSAINVAIMSLSPHRSRHICPNIRMTSVVSIDFRVTGCRRRPVWIYCRRLSAGVTSYSSFGAGFGDSRSRCRRIVECNGAKGPAIGERRVGIWLWGHFARRKSRCVGGAKLFRSLSTTTFAVGLPLSFCRFGTVLSHLETKGGKQRVPAAQSAWSSSRSRFNQVWT